MYPSSLTQETSKKGGDVERVGSVDIGGVSMTKSGISELEGDACYLGLCQSSPFEHSAYPTDSFRWLDRRVRAYHGNYMDPIQRCDEGPRY
ncbi:hypothetical protein H9L39_16220 [Fusarium oxysporum f. sp. albedinis]|nr:hypothetical protein H9L39_16220 [Fusarium oxysporum f. sp. albedinis]